MDYPVVEAEKRTDFGKGFARRMRAAGFIPAVVYSSKQETEHLTLPGHQMELLVRRPNALLKLKVAGSESLVLVKQVQRDPLRSTIDHIDMIFVNEKDTVNVRVPLRITGQTYAGTTPAIDNRSVKITVPATSIPEALEVSIDGLQAGKRIFAEDIQLPAGAKLTSFARALIVKVNAVRRAATPAEAAADK